MCRKMCKHRVLSGQGDIVRNSFGGLIGSSWRFWAAAAGAVWLVGCAASGALPPAPKTVEAPNSGYKIGPLDTLNIVVWRNPELSGPVTVRPDGFISLPLIGEMKAAGKSPTDLAQETRTALAKLVLEPVVSVVVTTVNAVAADQIRVVGEVAHPQAVVYRQDMTVLDVMIQVGGMTEFADGNAAVLIRGSEGGKQYSVRLKDLLKRGNIAANVAVMPGDIVMVPQGWF